MPTIPEEVVESMWRHVASLDPADGAQLMEEAAQRQPALLAYVMASTDRWRPELSELAVYLYYVILQMFEASAPGELGQVSMTALDEQVGRNESLMDRLQPAHERFLERAVEVESAKQPFVLRYISEALLEDEHPDITPPLTDEETGRLYLTLKTVVDALDEAISV